jgi:hypothetical protein
MMNFNEFKDNKDNSLQEMVYSIIFNLITDIPDSLLCPNREPDKRAEILIKQASIKAAAVSTSLSIPAGFTGVLTSIPDIAAVWRIQAQLVSDIACTYGKFAMLSREAMVWCLFRHSAASLLRDVAVRTGSRIVVQKLSLTALQKLLQRIGVKISANFLGRVALRAIPAIGAIGNGAYTYFDTNEVGKTAMAYFKALEGVEKPELVENEIDKDPESSETEEEKNTDETV